MDEVIEAMAKARFAALPILDGNGEEITLSDLIAGAIEPASVEAMQAQMDEAVRIIMTAAYNAMRAKLAPKGWVWSHRKFAHRVSEYPLTPQYHEYGGWTETPLYALPEIDNG